MITASTSNLKPSGITRVDGSAASQRVNRIARRVATRPARTGVVARRRTAAGSRVLPSSTSPDFASFDSVVETVARDEAGLLRHLAGGHRLAAGKSGEHRGLGRAGRSPARRARRSPRSRAGPARCFGRGSVRLGVVALSRLRAGGLVAGLASRSAGRARRAPCAGGRPRRTSWSRRSWICSRRRSITVSVSSSRLRRAGDR